MAEGQENDRKADEGIVPRSRLAQFRTILPTAAIGLLGLGMGVGAASGFGLFDVQDEFHDWMARGRKGQILVDTPEVYTRERLVNDRFREDEWLTDALKQARMKLDVSPGLQADEVAQTTTWAGDGAAAGGNGDSTSGSDAKHASPMMAVTLGQAAASGDDPKSIRTEAVRVRPIQEFIDVSELRRVVRDELLENQLDDRHDLDANTLLRLKFDASVLPERGGTGWALVTVELLPWFLVNGSSEDLCGKVTSDEGLCERAYTRIYNEWLGDMEERVSIGLRSGEASLSGRELGSRRELLLALSRKLDAELLRVGFTRAEIDEELRVRRKRLSDARDAYRQLGEKCAGHVAASSGPPKPTRRPWGFCAARRTAGTLGSIDGADACVCVNHPSLFPLDPPVHESLSALRDGDPDPLHDSVDLLVDVLKERGADRPCPEAGASPQEGRTRFVDLKVKLCGGAVVERDWIESWALTAVLLDEIRSTPVGDLAVVLPEGCSSGKCEVRFCGGPFVDECPPDGGFFDSDQPRVPDPLVEVTTAARLGEAEHRKRLARFKELLSESTAVFSYAVTPKTSAARVRRRAAELRALQADLGKMLKAKWPAAGIPLAMKDAVQRDLTAVASLPMIVGFSDGQSGAAGSWEKTPGNAATTFGWFIGPEFNGTSARGEQQAKQVALSALVSIPAWWNTLNLRVRACFVDDLEDPFSECDGSPVVHRIGLPGDAGAVSRALNFIIPREPYVLPPGASGALAGAEVELRAGRAGRILIEGQRLWRSTSVTLGAQPADSIEVLPNMEAIVARFDCIRSPTVFRGRQPPRDEALGRSGFTEYRVPVTVWTSEGKAPARPASVLVDELDLGCADPEVDEKRLSRVDTRLSALEGEVRKHAAQDGRSAQTQPPRQVPPAEGAPPQHGPPTPGP
jgi:hypothetical protein